MTRRDFVKGAAAAAVGVAARRGEASSFTVPKGEKIRSALLHLGMNMWGGYRAPGEAVDKNLKYGKEKCTTDRELWRKLTAHMQKRHFNHAVIDLGGGVEFQSHPEITLPGSFTPQEMRDEVKRLASMGIEAIPKINFSACHDAWLGIYGRMLSTPKYYEVVRDVIADACEMFGGPRYVHIGLDEENLVHSEKNPMTIIRRGELWWHDFDFYVKTLEKHGAQPMFFPTSSWGKDQEIFYRRVPKTAIMNVGFYGSFKSREEFMEKYAKRTGPTKYKRRVPYMFRELSERGYGIVTCVSNWVYTGDKKKYPTIPTGKDFPRDRESIAWAQKYIASETVPEFMLGGMVAPWANVSRAHEDFWIDGLNNFADSCEELGWVGRE